MPADLTGSPLDRLLSETEAALDWLIEPVDRGQPVTFVPNPGNVGDAMINLACWRYLGGHFDDVRIVSIEQQPETAIVFVGGGGNLVERYYVGVARFLAALPDRCQAFLFPVSVDGYGPLLNGLGRRLRIVCREATTYRHVENHLPKGHVRLGHDAAFGLAPWLAEIAGDRLLRLTKARARIFRADRERAIDGPTSFDAMTEYGGPWTDPRLAEKAVRLVATYMLGFGAVETDRLHGAILAALLGRETVLRPNAYFKNAAVFEHSLSRLPNVRFNGSLTG